MINTNAQKYGFTAITTTNTSETQRLIDEELSFEKAQDDKAQVAATDQSWPFLLKGEHDIRL